MDKSFGEAVRKYVFVMVVVVLSILVSLVALSAAAEAAPPIQIGGWSTDQQSAPLLPDENFSEPQPAPQSAPLLPEEVVIEERWNPTPLPSTSLKGFYGDWRQPWGILPEIPEGPRLEDKVPHVELIPGPGFGQKFMEQQNRSLNGLARALESYSSKPAKRSMFGFKTLEQELQWRKFWENTDTFFKDYWGGILVIILMLTAYLRMDWK